MSFFTIYKRGSLMYKKYKFIHILTVFMFFSLAGSIFAEAGKNLIKIKETNLPKISTQLTGYAVGESNGALILAGGKTATGFNENAYVLESGSKSWKKFDINLKDFKSSFTSDGNSLYTVGGKSNPEAVYKLTWNDGKVKVKQLTSLPEKITGAGIGVLDNKLFVLGSGKDNFLSLDLGSSNSKWKIEPDFPVEGITDPSIVVQRRAFIVVSAKVDGKPENISYAYRIKNSDPAVVNDKGWKKLDSCSFTFEPNEAVTTGQSHVAVVKNGKVYLYHTVTDVWCEGRDIVGKTNNSHAISWGNSIIIFPKDFDNAPIKAEFEGVQKALSWLDYAVILIYLAAMIGIGIYFANKEKNTDDYFLGGRKIPWWAAGVSMWAAGTSAMSYMATPEKSFSTNILYSVGSAVVWVPIAIIIGGYLIVPLVRRLGYTTAFTFLEDRFHFSLRLLGSFKQIIWQLFARMVMVLLLPAMAISILTGLNVYLCVAILGIAVTVYTTLGGFKAVIWTDLAQTIILIGGAIAVLTIMILQSDGGFTGFISTSIQYDKFRWVDWSLDITKPIIWIFLVNALLGDLQVLSDQTTAQRFLSTPTVKEARRSFIFLQLMVIPANLLFVLIGVAMFAYYKAHPAMLSPVMENIHAIPTFMIQGLPTGVCGLLVAGLLAACMSTLNSSINSVSTMFVTDWYKRFNGKTDEHHNVVVARWATALSGVFATCAAMGLAAFEINSFFDMWIIVTAILGGGIGGMFVLGMFTKKGNWIGAWCGALASILITIYIQFFSNINIAFLLPCAIGACIAVGYIVSIFTPWAGNKNLEGLTIWTPKKTAIEK